MASETGLEVVVVRPPLVYGPGVKGNFAQMLDVVAKHIPLPFASIHNYRSLIYVGESGRCTNYLRNPSSRSRAHLSGMRWGRYFDAGLAAATGSGMGVPSCLFPCPPALLCIAGKLAGKSQQLERLLGSLRVDSDKMRADLNWIPPYSLQQGLQATAEWFRTNINDTLRPNDCRFGHFVDHHNFAI